MSSYRVTLHPDGGFQFIGRDLTGADFALHLDPFPFLLAAGRAEAMWWRSKAHTPFRDDRDAFDESETLRPPEKT